MRHLHALMLCVIFSATSPLSSSCCPSSLLSSCFSSWPSTPSTMWWTNSLCTSGNEDLGTLAECDPLTVLICRVLAMLLGGKEQRVAELPDVFQITTFLATCCALLASVLVSVLASLRACCCRRCRLASERPGSSAPAQRLTQMVFWACG